MSTANESHPIPGTSAPSGEVGGLRLWSARATWLLHVGVVGFLLTGWAWPWPLAWSIYAIAAPFIQIGWVVFDDHCWLSIIEAKLRGVPLVVETVEGDEARSFVGELLESILKRPVPRWLPNALSYGVLWGGFVICCWRLYRLPG